MKKSTLYTLGALILVAIILYVVVQSNKSPTPSDTLPDIQVSTASASITPAPSGNSVKDNEQNSNHDVVLVFPSDKYPKTAAHIKAAIQKGESEVCTIDRHGADQNREDSLRGIKTKKGYDRDEWPMAMCIEGGEGADVAYVPFSDNRGSGSWVGNQLEEYPDGTKILFVIKDGQLGNVESANKSLPGKSVQTQIPTGSSTTGEVFYKNCSAVRAAGTNPLHKGDPGYSTKLDRDGDGVACE